MDIKDIILFGGGLLIVAVVIHGFWIAWRARRDPLRMDLISELPVEDVDEMQRLRAELPNGGARVIQRGTEEPRQVDLPLGEPSPGRHAGGGVRTRADAAPSSRRAETDPRPDARARRGRTEPRVAGGAEAEAAQPQTSAAPAQAAPSAQRASAQGASAQGASAQRAEAARSSVKASAPAVREPAIVAQPPAERSASRAKVADVIMPERSGKRGIAETTAASGATAAPPAGEGSMARQAARKFNDFVDRAGGRSGDEGSRTADRSAGKKRQGTAENRKAEPPVEELIMISLLATKGEPFVGAGLVEALRSRGLRYGDMNIFHRIDPMTRATLYSVANVVEPGTFDMVDLEQFRSPGICFFMQLPGPEHPMEAFEDMLKVARDVAARAGGELKDEQRSVMTGQTVEHYRQRISDFCRRRMSMRA